jgi:hypothetical protein
MRAKEFISEKEKLDEILPLITGAASLVGGAASLAGGVASAAGSIAKGVGKGIGAAASGIGSAVGGIGNAVGAVGNRAASAIGLGSRKPKAPDLKQLRDVDRAKDQLIRPGKKIILPTQGIGGPQAFNITKVQGDEVEIENPDGNKSPNQPNKLVYNKGDIKKSITL